MENYTYRIQFENTTTKAIYDALTVGISNWWTEMFEGTSDVENSVFTIRFGEQVFKTIKVETLANNEKVLWLVTDALIDFPELKNKSEWIGTKIEWKIIRNEKAVELQLVHFGLTPQMDCFTMCEAGWQTFTHSLSEYILTGKGTPFKST